MANIAPYYEVRDFIRKNIKEYIQIYLNMPVEKAMEMDVKGHYAKYKGGLVKNIVGLDDAYDIPRNPDLTVNTNEETIEESLERIVNHLEKSGVQIL